MAIFTAIATAILGTTLAATTAFTIGATAITFGAILATTLQALTIFGGMALSMALSKKSAGDYGASSPTYANGIIQTQTNQDLPIPLLYGTCKLAGNRIWQHDDGTKTVKRIVGFAEGEITDFTDIRFNDIEAGTISGASINKYYGTATQTVDPIIDGSTHETRAEIVGSLRNLAYLAVSVPRSNDIDVNYNLTSIVKGRKIRVYSSPSPTSYSIMYSENPAWVMFDFLTSYNGLGLCLKNDGTIDNNAVMELFDLESFIEAAAFCDEELEYTANDGSIKKSPRFTFNMIFDSQTSARDLIDEIYRCCRGGLFTKNGKLQFKIDKAEEVSKVFTAEDIVKGSETFTTIPSEEHYDILKLVYISPDHEWQKVEAFAEIPEYRDGVPVEHSVNCYSITNFQQASRLAWYYVNSKRLCPYYGSFKTDYRAFDLEVGDVIKFDSLLMGLTGYLAKVTSVSNDGAGTYTVNWRTYDERLYSDELGSKEPRVLVSNLQDQYAPPDDVRNFNVIQQYTNFNFSWSLNQNSTDLYEIRMGESWEAGKIIGSNLKSNNFTYPIPTNGIYKFWIKATTSYQYSKNPTLDVINVNSIPNIDEILNIDLIKTAAGDYDNTYKYHDSIKLEPIAQENKTFNILENMQGEFLQMVEYNGILKLKTLNSVLWQTTNNTWGNDNYYKFDENWGALPHEEGGYISQVYDIEALTNATVNFETEYHSNDKNASVAFQWQRSNDGIKWTDWEPLTFGAYKYRYFRIKININSSAQVFITKFKVNVEFKILWQTTEIPWNTGENQYYQKNGIWGTFTKAIGSYISQIYDIGLLYECVVNFESQYISKDPQANIDIYCQYSKDGIDWTEWKIINNGTYLFRYFRVKVIFNAYNSLQLSLTSLKVKIDVKEKSYTSQIDITEPSSGLTIYYDFVKKPAIVATVADNIAKYAVIDDKTQTNKQATIYVYNNAGGLTTAKVNLLIQGY